MPKHSTPKTRTSYISSAAHPAASSTTSAANNSSILKSSFSPSRFQLSLFASVIQGLDSQHLRIHDTTTGRLRCEHAIGSRASITCLDWGYYAANNPRQRHKEVSKKRKRTEHINGDTGSRSAADVMLALGTSDSQIQLFSPAEAKTIGLLKGGHTQGVRNFKFAHHGERGEGWSLGGDERIVQWDLDVGRPVRTIQLPKGPASAIQPLGSSVICASHQAYILDPNSQTSNSTFNASTHPVHTIVGQPSRSSRGAEFLTAAHADRFLNVFHEQSPTLIGSLRTENEVLQVDFYTRHRMLETSEACHDLAQRLMRPEEGLLIVNKDGALELFPEPFDFGSPESQGGPESTKERMKRRTRRSAAQLRIIRPDKTSTVPLINASFQDNHVVLAWAEGGINVLFHSLPWRDERTGTLLLVENMEIVKRKSDTMEAIVMNGVKDMGMTHVDESHTLVSSRLGPDEASMDDQQPQVINISSGEEESESEEEDIGPSQRTNATPSQDVTDAQNITDVEMKDTELSKEVDSSQQEAKEVEEPSFGDMLRARAAEAVDVQASLIRSNTQSLLPATDKRLQQLPGGVSLGTVLTQSLRTNDKNLLETCFQVKDLRTVRATIERLESSFATTLLERLAERLHSRPGRAGSLMVWIQWTLVAHGGYLAGQAEVMKKLASLHRVVKDRANSLQSLLSLKGKLDMLEAQMNLRKSMQRKSQVDDEDDDEGIVYVEGQEESESESEQNDEEAGDRDEDADVDQAHAMPDTQNKYNMTNAHAEKGYDVNTGTEIAMVNGNVADSEDEGIDSDEEGMFEEEVSSTDEDSGEELSGDEIDHDDVDTDSSDADTSPPPKRPATHSSSER